MPERESEVVIHLPDLVDEASLVRLGSGAARLALGAAARLARARWLALAHDRLRGHGRDLAAYVAAIGQPVLDGDRVVIRLTGDAAARIEAGREQVDLRQVLLGDRVPVLSPGQSGRGKRQNRAGGYYRAIPMPPRGGAPEAPAAPTGAAGDASLMQELTAAARALSASATPGGPQAASGSGLPLSAQAPAGLTTDPMARLYGQEGALGGGGPRLGPVQFRTISTSQGRGWMLRPVPGALIMRDLERALAREVPAAIDKMLACIHLPGAAHEAGG